MTMKISEWLPKTIDAWSIYDSKTLGDDFKTETGLEPCWRTHDSRQTRRDIKMSKSGGEIDRDIPPEEQLCYGYEMAYDLAQRYAKYTSDKMGRGFMFRDCIEALDNAGF